MDQSEHEGDETHDESDDSEDEEALVVGRFEEICADIYALCVLQEIDPAKILPTRIRPNVPKIDYASPEAIARAGVAVPEEGDAQDAEYVPIEETVHEEEDHSMQQ